MNRSGGRPESRAAGKRAGVGWGPSPPVPAFVWQPLPRRLALPRCWPRAVRLPAPAGLGHAGGRGHTHPGVMHRWRRAAARGRGLPAPVPNFPPPHNKAAIVCGIWVVAFGSRCFFFFVGFLFVCFFFPFFFLINNFHRYVKKLKIAALKRGGCLFSWRGGGFFSFPLLVNTTCITSTLKPQCKGI